MSNIVENLYAIVFNVSIGNKNINKMYNVIICENKKRSNLVFVNKM